MLYADIVHKVCIVEIAGGELEEDIILLDIMGFNVILKMDWLITYHANIDCFSKKILFKIPNGEPFSI